jgi:enoyl-CoA hydratase/carnithine racemase
MSNEQITSEVEDRILTITLNRPDKLNAVTHQMNNEIIDALDRADADDEVRVVIMTGAGRAFCAGADMSAGADTFDYDARAERSLHAEGSSRAEGSSHAEGSGAGRADEVDWSDPRIRDGGGLVSLRIYECVKPVIGAINGAAVGQGVTMTLPMDVRLASDGARFGFVFSRRGIVPEACSTYFLPRLVGVAQALRWMYSGRVFGASEALRGGLVEAVHPPERLLEAAREIAREIVDHTAPVSVALIRQMVWRLLGADHPMEAHKLESRGVYALGQLADSREGVVSFLEKRPPEFSLKPSEDMPGFYPWWEERSYD